MRKWRSKCYVPSKQYIWSVNMDSSLFLLIHFVAFIHAIFCTTGLIVFLKSCQVLPNLWKPEFLDLTLQVVMHKSSLGVQFIEFVVIVSKCESKFQRTCQRAAGKRRWTLVWEIPTKRKVVESHLETHGAPILKNTVTWPFRADFSKTSHGFEVGRFSPVEQPNSDLVLQFYHVIQLGSCF